MRIETLNPKNLIPQAYGNVFRNKVKNFIESIRNKNNVPEILCLSDGNSLFYVLDGHHRVIAYSHMNLNIPSRIIENEEDLLRTYYQANIWTTNITLAQKRAQEQLGLCKKKGIENFTDLERILI